MSDAVKLSTFPGTATEALTLLYLQNQDLSKKTPEEIQTMYWEARQRILNDFKAKKNSGWFKAL